MTELEGVVLIAQLRRLDHIRDHLRANAAAVRGVLETVPGLAFREQPDPAGDLATHLVVIYPDAAIADVVTATVGSITLGRSGWHVYNHMEHLLAMRTVDGRSVSPSAEPFRAGMLPATDALLARSMSFAIGVRDPNLAPFGLTVRDDTDVAVQQAERLREAVIQNMGA